MNRIFKLLPKEIVDKIDKVKEKELIEEIRISIGKKIHIIIKGKEVILPYIIADSEIKGIIQKISNYSLYAIEDELKQGYVTIEGGHRIGIAGQCVIENRSVKTIKHISSLNIRIAREIVGCSNKIMKELVTNGCINNTLIISPPRCGKTTILRDISRNISDGYNLLNLKGRRVVIIDERSEIASCHKGIPQMRVGERTDVYDNCTKDDGLMMAIRTMSPDVIVCDEIGSTKDVEGIEIAFNSGVNVICTLHGNSINDLYNREVFRKIINQKLIKKVIILSNKNGPGSIEEIYNL
ncbi:MAG: stage III sporulation protein AA [Sarcina sp.]